MFSDDEYPQVVSIVQELLKPENRAVYIAVCTSEQSFMWGFTQTDILTYDEYKEMSDSLYIAGLTAETDIDKAYADYVAKISEHNDAATLNKALTEQFNALVDPIVGHWTGAAYGFAMRRVQAILKSLYTRRN